MTKEEILFGWSLPENFCLGVIYGEKTSTSITYSVKTLETLKIWIHDLQIVFGASVNHDQIQSPEEWQEERHHQSINQYKVTTDMIISWKRSHQLVEKSVSQKQTSKKSLTAKIRDNHKKNAKNQVETAENS